MGVVGRAAERATDNRRMTEAQRLQPGPRLPWSEAARQRQMILDAAHGRQVLACLAQFGCGHTVVVSRRHVLAVAAGEATADVLARVGQLRQWGDGRTRARRGVLVVRAAVVAPDVIEAAAAAGLAGVQVVGMGLPGPEAIARAERAGITLLAGAA